MRCMSCRAEEMQENFTTYFTTFSGGYVIIENVPCLKCSQCGETFFRTSVIQKIEEILNRVETLASKVCILDYQTAA